MRQNYGTDWLLSTPNLILNNNATIISNKKNEVSNLAVNPKETTKYTNKYNNIEIKNEIETFAVYRSICDTNSGDFIIDDKKLCILSLNDKYLIERDETNTEILNLEEISLLNVINLIAKSAEE